MIGGALALAACDSSLSAEEVVENSLESYDDLEGYTQELTMDGETSDVDFAYTQTKEPLAVEQILDGDDFGEHQRTFRYIEEDLYMDDETEGWVKLDEDIPYFSAMSPVLLVEWDEDLTEEDLPSYRPILEKLNEEDEEAFTFNDEEEEQYTFTLTLEDDEANEWLELLGQIGGLDFANIAAEEGGEMSADSLEVEVVIESETFYVTEQTLEYSGEITAPNGESREYSQQLSFTFDSFNDVEAVEAPEDAISISEELEATATEPEPETTTEDFGDFAEEDVDVEQMLGVLTTGEGDPEGAEDLHVLMPPVYGDSEYHDTVRGFEAHIPDFNSMTPNGTAMTIWAALATQEDDQWDAWFVVVNRLGMDISKCRNDI